MKLNKRDLGLIDWSVRIHMQEVAKTREVLNSDSEASKLYSRLYELREKLEKINN